MRYEADQGPRRPGRKQALCVLLAGALAAGQPLSVLATSRQQIEQERNEAQQGLDEANEEAREAEQNRNAAQGAVDDLTEQLTDLIAEITLLEEDIAAKEVQIEQAQADFDAAKAKEQDQYEDMKKRIRYMYEKGDTEFLDVLLKVKSMSELLNKSEYIENIYSYDRQKLQEYKETKEEVQMYQEQLDLELNEMESMQLEYAEQQSALETMIAQKRAEVANFDAQLAQAKAAADSYAKTIAQKNEQIRRAEEEERRRQEEARRQAAAGPSASNGGTSGAAPTGGRYRISETVTKSSGGTAQGREIADYALQFVGNPYVYGGTSLTNGTDCSGFTQSVYKHFGYSLSRSSASQRSDGYAVDYSQAQPGDLICYPGHVALYIGNGRIVHASGSKVGIIVSEATYRSIMCVRRILPS